MAARVFLDPRLNRAFRRRGWVVVDAFPPEDAHGLADLHERIDDGLGTGYFTSTVSPRPDLRREVDEHITSTFGGALTALLDGYEAFLGALVVKRADGDSIVHAHQDGTCNDEEPLPGVVAWIPATSMDDGAGYLRGLWGSHRYVTGVRSTPPITAPFEEARDDLLAEHMETIVVRPGQALLFDSRLVHGSEPNRSGRTRLAAYMRLHPVGAPARHYWWDSDAGVVRGYEVDREFFLTHVWNERPDEPSSESFAPGEMPQMSVASVRWRRVLARVTPAVG